MPFEPVSRVKFRKNPLVEVVCQLAFFSTVDEIVNGQHLIKLHDLVKEELPLFKKAKSVSLHVNADTQTVSNIEKPVFEFSSLDESIKVVLEPDSLSCVTTAYESKEKFFGTLFKVYDALDKLDLLVPYKRVGLRYRDVIQRSALGDAYINADWSRLLKEPLVAILQQQELVNNLLGSQSNFTLALESIHKNAKMNATYGIINSNQNNEKCFLIDSDFYIEGVIKNDSARKFLDDANIKARDFFRWCIKPELFDALNPEPLE
ncbi:hypothetical protein C6Y40_02400 [Alteromonas alba]|uniref:TIGR04255 family protein n=1 Tax=Alteromonas alba TaxID=2079529 RepID=A0A2S9VFF0_9ALTE|nr:TIGR04255 family protein [Alteromonas alba]PRO75187.1 hypothetical protein C6Y40_02400 [Alteromonas alba]